MDQSFYQVLLDSLADGVYFVDRDWRVTYWNKAAERISGFAAQEVVGNTRDEHLTWPVAAVTEGRPESLPLVALSSRSVRKNMLRIDRKGKKMIE